jgi:hypothetical protein
VPVQVYLLPSLIFGNSQDCWCAESRNRKLRNKLALEVLSSGLSRHPVGTNLLMFRRKMLAPSSRVG